MSEFHIFSSRVSRLVYSACTSYLLGTFGRSEHTIEFVIFVIDRLIRNLKVNFDFGYQNANKRRVVL